MDTMRTSLYRFFDDDGALLYIGITKCLPAGVYSRLKLLIGEGRYTSEADYEERGPSTVVDPFFGLEDYDDYEDYGEPYEPELRPGQRPPGLYTLEEFLAGPEPPEYRSLEAWLRSHDLFLELVEVTWALMPPHHHLQTSCASCGWYRAEEDAA